MKFISKVRSFVKRNEKYVSPIALFGGFVIDSLTLQRIDLFFENFILGSYLILSGVLIFIISLIQKEKLRGRFFLNSIPFLNIALLFVFGGLFSGFTIFYVRSANFLSSWPFILLLVLVMISTEYLKKYFSALRIQFLVFYFALYTYLIFLVPILIKKIDVWVFLLSGGLSLFLIFVFLKLFSNIYKKSFVEDELFVKRAIISVFVVVNLLYFLNIIPPIPLSLKDSDVYQRIDRQGDQYVVLDYQKKFADYLSFPEKIKVRKGSPLYFYSSIFAPTKLNAKVIHEWQFKDDSGWESRGEIPFTITGGADRGFRGFSVKTNLEEGLWRVDIKLANGQIIGRKNFKIEFAESGLELISKVK